MVAEEFANYFSTVADGIGVIPPTLLGSFNNFNHGSKIEDRWYDNSFSFREITCSDVLDSLRQLNSNKAIGHDLIPPSALRNAAEELAAPLTTLYNQVIQQGVWTDDWKWGEWILFTRRTIASPK